MGTLPTYLSRSNALSDPVIVTRSSTSRLYRVCTSGTLDVARAISQTAVSFSATITAFSWWRYVAGMLPVTRTVSWIVIMAARGSTAPVVIPVAVVSLKNRSAILRTTVIFVRLAYRWRAATTVIASTVVPAVIPAIVAVSIVSAIVATWERRASSARHDGAGWGG